MKADDLDNDCAKTGFASLFGTTVCNVNHSNVRYEPRPDAEAQRTLEAVGCRRWCGRVRRSTPVPPVSTAQFTRGVWGVAVR